MATRRLSSEAAKANLYFSTSSSGILSTMCQKNEQLNEERLEYQKERNELPWD